MLGHGEVLLFRLVAGNERKVKKPIASALWASAAPAFGKAKTREAPGIYAWCVAS